MKDKILTFIIGALAGAIIATICFYCYSKNNTSKEFTPGDRPQMMEQDGRGGPPDMKDGNGDFGGRKDRNSSENESTNENTLPAKPDEDSNTAGDENKVPEKDNTTTMKPSENETDDA